MPEKYGMFCMWDEPSRRYVAQTPNYPRCQATGKTRSEAVTLLDVSVKEWQAIGREPVPTLLAVLEGEVRKTYIPSVIQSAFEGMPDEKARRGTRVSLLQDIHQAFSALTVSDNRNTRFLDMEITENPCVVHLRGEMDLTAMPSVANWIGQVAQANRQIIFDLREVLFLDSSGIAMMISACKTACRDGGRACIVVPHAKGSQVERVLRLGRIDTIMPLCFSLEEATEVMAVSPSSTS